MTIEIFITFFIIILSILFLFKRTSDYKAYIRDIKELQNQYKELKDLNKKTGQKFNTSQKNLILIRKMIEIEKQNSIVSDVINRKKIKNIETEILNILIFARALYYRKISNIIINRILQKFGNNFEELGVFKDSRDNSFSFIKCTQNINNFERKKITSIIDFLISIKEDSSEIIHLNFIFGGIEIPKDYYLHSQQKEEDSKEVEQENPPKRQFINNFIVNINIVLDYLFNENKKDIISKYIRLINPEDFNLNSKNIEEEIDKAISEIIIKNIEQNKNNEEINKNKIKEKNQIEEKDSISEEKEENEKNQENNIINNIKNEGEDYKDEIDNKNYKDYLKEIECILKESRKEKEENELETGKIINEIKSSIKRNNKLIITNNNIKLENPKNNFISSDYFFNIWKNKFTKFKEYRNNVEIKNEIDFNITLNEIKEILLNLLENEKFNLFNRDVGNFTQYIKK